MLSYADPIGKIQQIYMEGDRQVPYTTFMSVFNGLLLDKVKIEPREPEEELRELFRAACMVANVGIFDREGRGEKRLAEFREKVLPVWKEALSAEEWEAFEDVLTGRVRRRAGGSDRREKTGLEPTGRQAEVLERLGLLGRKRTTAGQQPEAPAEAEPAGRSAQPSEPEPLPDVFPGVDALVAALKDGRLELTYTTREESRELARYRLDEHEVSVMAARADSKTYAVLKVPIGHKDLAGNENELYEAAAAMRYAHMKGHAYMRDAGEVVYTLRVGPHATSMACALAEDSPDEAVLLQLQRLHRDLGELLERLGV